MDLRMYILVNEDIKINKGKLAGQVGHAVNVYVYHIMNDYFKNIVENRDNWNSLDIAKKCLLDEYMAGSIKKIILYAPQNKLEDLENKNFTSIRDIGFTDLEPNTLTCVNLGIIDYDNIPNEVKFIKELKLCR